MRKKTKLISKTSKNFLLTGLILTIFSSIVLYFYTKNLLQEEIEEELYSTEARVSDALENHKIVYSLPPVSEIKKVKKLRPEILKDTLIYDPSQDEMELFRELSTYKKIHDDYYHITIRTLVVESGSILLAIVISNISLFVLAFIFLFYFNTARNLKIWQPFFDNLEAMKKFSLTSKEALLLTDSDVLEFSDLKDQIEFLTSKVKVDYENLKQFTENISHEIQTPLAIIQAKIDNIINEHAINDLQFEQITSIQKDLQRLKQLNKKITTLTKIDNNQYVRMETISLTELIDEKIEDYKELDLHNIAHISNDELFIKMDPFLADILINNLVSNAIKHSSKNSSISILTEKQFLKVSNSGESSLIHPEKLHLRFYREDTNNRSTGLGLAIVRKICDLYGFKMSYHFEGHRHIFNIDFKNSN
ncbi:sensor histidine kinase [Gelidibacter gilvus]|uniref:histidine kinase n=1 Tax=Gelidibacter gilvus TaxID=59602 RepID=A0A4Q0XIA8_9FLAO|nr:HAMP domain-containing sensor histidine kinase [Gelidibacter gilvus]RXJ51334.1 HAMP domain-containing histidine kinase [Gelidibacter gilvus]